MGSLGDGRSRSLVLALTFVLGCGSGGSGGGGTGGSQGTGGATGSGGASASGGSHGSGGSNGTGGVSATGGSLGTGGASATGGSSGTGGAHATGGSTGTGGASGTGGSVGVGGAAGKGAAGGSGTGGAGSGGLGGGGGHGGASSGTGGTSATGGASGSTGTTDGGALPGWVLTWSDEFNGPDGSAVDSTKWVYDTGGGGWGNNELETYTSGTANAVIQGGNLVITAASAGASSYTSARLKTLGKFSQQYGRFEARIQMPEGQGLWPAFWMMGADINTVNWPSCGEIDVMENIGKEPSINHGSLHMPATGGTTDDQLTGMYTLSGGAKLGDSFHTYAVEWTSSTITFYVDDMLYETQTQQGASGRTWEFNKPFFILLNVAVGGTWPGSPDSTTTFPQTMKVDWVRAYQPAN